MKNIVIFASGSGSNAEKIMDHFAGNPFSKVVAVFSNKAESGVVEKAKIRNVSTVVFSKSELEDGTVMGRLQDYQPDLIVLAGFLLKVPDELIEAYPRKIVNIHPALLPKFGGKGMYGMNVHRAVADQKENETGVTIHYVDGHYDNGDVIFQAKIALDGSETCDEIASMVQKLEHEHYPRVLSSLLHPKSKI